jgi:alpha-tubulin suppressor-like RCC1 family protein
MTVCHVRRFAVLYLMLAACGDGAGPAAPAPPAGALRFTDISAGYYHTCALTASGTTWCWGENGFGTLGDGSRTDRRRPAAVAATTSFSAIDAGAGHNCALTAQGTAWCWGQNDEGQLGDATVTIRDRPVTVAGDRAFTQVSAGHAHSCALTAAGTAWCWGDNSSGQLGTGQTGGKSEVPVQVVSPVPFARIEAGYYQTCALDTAGLAWCWGQNDSGQIGDGSGEGRAAPVAVSGDRQFTDLSAGDRFVCGLSGGEAWCWGAARAGELGPHPPSATPVRLQGTGGATHVRASMGSSTNVSAHPYGCVLRNGRAECWGGAIRALREAGAAPARLEPTFGATALAAGSDHVCVLDRRGYAYCGGGNYFGQLGDGTQIDRGSLVSVGAPAF